MKNPARFRTAYSTRHDMPGRSPQFDKSSDVPSPLMDIELHQAFIPHFQQQGLASFLIRDIGAFHDLVHFERLLSKGNQDLFSFIQHGETPTLIKRANH
ncbi:hypothetical protein [Bradyrhizobium sp. CSA207]|uniref:hypothetical protein n=1 Tax=Bradyrhizobium sp. CSA207 TaxID=2698826 RepID=UPI0023AFB7E3|nr:hypothetical protein [Bradyrhizobium sp. CSA207]